MRPAFISTSDPNSDGMIALTKKHPHNITPLCAALHVEYANGPRVSRVFSYAEKGKKVLDFTPEKGERG